MDWTMYIAIGFCVLTLGSLIMNYLNHVEINNLRQAIRYNTNELDGINKRLRDNEYSNRETMQIVNSKLNGFADTLKYNYFTQKEIYAMWDIHSTRVNSYFDDLTRNHQELISYRNVLRRLEPLAPLADKFDLKKRIKASKEYQAGLVSDLKETERELKDLA